MKIMLSEKGREAARREFPVQHFPDGARELSVLVSRDDWPEGENIIEIGADVSYDGGKTWHECGRARTRGGKVRQYTPDGGKNWLPEDAAAPAEAPRRDAPHSGFILPEDYERNRDGSFKQPLVMIPAIAPGAQVRIYIEPAVELTTQVEIEAK